jgi:hypothetical protein
MFAMFSAIANDGTSMIYMCQALFKLFKSILKK